MPHFLILVAKTLLVPLLLIYLLFVVLDLPTDWRTVALAYGLFIPLWIFLASMRKARARNTQARLFGVSTIPQIRGWLPGNIDILWQLIYNESHEYCGETLRKWAELYGPTYDMNILFAHQIVTVDPANVKHILANQFESFAKGEKFHHMLKTFLGEGVFTTDGDEWKYHRAMVRPFLSAERTSDFDCFEKHTSTALEIILEHSRQGKALDMQDLFSRFTLDTGTEFLFGHSVKSLHETGPKAHSDRAYITFSDAFNTMSTIAMRRVRIGSMWSLFEIGSDPTKKPMEAINALVDSIVQSAAMTSRGAEIELKESTFLDHVIKTTQDTKLVRDTLLNLLLAARDTTASLLTFVTYVLALHPEVTRNLKEEIGQTLGERGSPTISDIRQMKYLRAVLNEVLRLFPPVPFNIRRCVKPSILPSPLSKKSPFYVAPGVSITYSPLLIQRRVDLWGESASVFDPQRWLGDGPKPHVTNPFTFLPFNGGPRMCLGQQFAYHECSYFVIRMLQTFNKLEIALDAHPADARPPEAWSTSTIERQGVEKCWPGASLTLYSKGGLWIRTKV